MVVSVSGPIQDAKKTERVAIVYGETAEGATPEIDNAYSIYFALMSRGYKATIMKDTEWSPYVYPWTVVVGGPCTNMVAEQFNDMFPDRFLVTSQEGCIYWPCRIQTFDGDILTADDDGVVTTVKLTQEYLTMVAGCTRTGTDYATFQFIDELERETPIFSVLRMIVVGGIAAGLGYVIGKSKGKKRKHGRAD